MKNKRMTKFQQELLDWLHVSPDNYISTTKYWGYMGIHHTFRRAFGFKGDATPILPKTWEAIFPYMDCASYTPYRGITFSTWVVDPARVAEKIGE